MIPIWLLSGRLGNQMFQLAYLYAQQRRGLTPDIWLQSPEHFAGSEDYIKEVFSEGIEPLNEPFVAMHVRRGDYVKHAGFVQLWDTDYYDRAMAMFPGMRFLVVSDDIEWCRQRFVGPQFEFPSGTTEIEDLNLMASCHHNIIANSSFSWWAAYLNPNPNKIVVYPKAWHADQVVRVGFPKEWVAL
jgi:hypothetical protein